MDLCGRNMEERRDLCLNVVQRMDLHPSLLSPEQSPFKDAQAEIDRRRVKCVDVAAQFEDFGSPTLLCFSNDFVCELLEDVVVPTGIGLRQVALRGRLPKDEVIGLRLVSLSRQDNIPKTLSIRQLAEHQDSQLVPAGERLDITITTVSVCYSEEYILIDEV